MKTIIAGSRGFEDYTSFKGELGNVSTNAVFGRTKNKDFPDWQFIPK